jgi:hypothetical protein
MILNIFEIFKENMSSGLYNTIPIEYIYVFIIAIFVLILFLLFVIFFPLFKRSPEKLYRRYLFLREEMRRIDDSYSRKELLYTEYVSMQFINLQEFYAIIKKLKDNPIYKPKLQNYSVKYVKDQNNYNSQNIQKTKPVPLTKEDTDKKQINKLVDILKPKVNLYTKEDIYAVLLSEGFQKDIIDPVIKSLSEQNVSFSKITSSDENKQKLSLSIDNFFQGTRDTKPTQTSYSIFDKKEEKSDLFQKDFKNKEINFNKIDAVDYKLKKEKEDVLEKPSFWSKISSVFKKKKEEEKQVHSADEIDNIFKNIENELKNKDL